MRLFLAADVTDDVKAWVARVRRAAEQRKPALARSLRWVQPDQVHATLRFLGETEPTHAERLVQVLAAGVAVAPFTYVLATIDWFPPRGRPRVLVATIGDGGAAMRELKRALDETLARGVGASVDDREFVAHLTLARVRDQEGPGVASMRRELPDALGAVPLLSVRVEHATLYRSELSPSGPRYSVVARAPLTGAGS